MNIPRWGHTATLLPNGKVLIAGGEKNSGELLTQAEIYDPLIKNFSLVSKQNEPHSISTHGNGILLKNGKVFFSGLPGRHAELFNPKTNQFELISYSPLPREGGSLSLLQDGKIFIVGGQSKEIIEKSQKKPGELVSCNNINCDYYIRTKEIKKTEIYDYKKNRFYYGPNLNINKSSRRLISLQTVLLDDGRVLIPPEYVFTPKKLVITKTASMIHEEHSLQKGQLLPNGNVLFYPGEVSVFPAELFVTSKNLYVQIPKKITTKESTTVLIDKNNILYTGGETIGFTNNESNIAEIYNFKRNEFIKIPNMLQERKYHSATMISEKKILICGGITKNKSAYSTQNLTVTKTCENFIIKP